MAVKTQGNYVPDWLVDEFGAPNYCRVVVTILADQVLKSGAVLGLADGTDKYQAFDKDAAAGISAAHGILLEDVDATGADKKGVAIIRGPVVVSKAGLTYLATQHAADITAALADLSALTPPIIAVEGV